VQDCFAVFLSTFGPGAAFSCYSALMGWYEHALHSKAVTIHMRVVVFFPFPVMLMLQGLADAYFDRTYGAKAAYFVRLVFMQLLLPVLMCTWIRLQLVHHHAPEAGSLWLLVVGAFLGMLSSVCLGSSVKVAAAMDAGLVVWAQLGFTFGNVVTILWIELLGITPDSGHDQVCLVLALPVCICVFAALLLTGAFKFEVFDAACTSIDLTREKELQNSRLGLLASTAEANYGSTLCLDSERQPSAGVAANGAEKPSSVEVLPVEVPTWIWLWCSAQVIGQFSDFVLLSFVGYFGDEQVTHRLAGLVFIASLLGRLLSLPLRYLPGFHDGPLHILSACSFLIRATISVLLMGCLLGYAHLENTLLFVLWSCLYTNSMISHSLTDMTTTMHAPKSLRHDIAHRCLMSVYVAIFCGILMVCVCKDSLRADSK